MRNLRRVVCLTTAAMVVLGSGVAFAGHDESNLIGLRLTVQNVNQGQVTVQITGQQYSGLAIVSGRLGSQFWYDGSTSLDRWVTPVPPALDWGDGSTVLNLAIPFTYQTSTSTTSGRAVSRFTGQFMHTYAAPGNYTIRSFGTAIYAECCSTTYAVTYGNAFSALSPVMAYNSGSYTTTRFTGTYPIGVTNTVMASVTQGGGGGPAGAGVPGPVTGICGLIGIELLLVYPFLAIQRRRKA